MHIVVLRHFEKSDPDAVYYGSLREAVRAVEPGTKLFSVWGAVFDAERGSFSPEDISEDFLAAWALTRRETLEADYWSGEAKFEYGASNSGLARYLDHALCPPEFVFGGPVTASNNRVIPEFAEVGFTRLPISNAQVGYIRLAKREYPGPSADYGERSRVSRASRVYPTCASTIPISDKSEIGSRSPGTTNATLVPEEV